MPTPYGSRGGMAFGVAELRVLRRALALALHPGQASAEDVQDCFRLAESLDEAMCEGVRLRAFLVTDLGRYRAALPGTAAGYLRLLEEALGAGHRPTPDDLAALRALRGNAVAAALLEHCLTWAEQDVRARFAQGARKVPAPAVPAARTCLLALPGGSGEAGAGESEEADKPERKPAPKPAPAPAERPARQPEPTTPKRPIPTPGEVFPRRRPQTPPRQLAVS